jgi:hypothetical protein
MPQFEEKSRRRQKTNPEVFMELRASFVGRRQEILWNGGPEQAYSGRRVSCQKGVHQGAEINSVARSDMLHLRTISRKKTRRRAVADIIVQGQRKGKQAGPQARAIDNGFSLQFKKMLLEIRILIFVRIKESRSSAYHQRAQGLPVFKAKVGDYTSIGVLLPVLSRGGKAHFFALRQTDEFLPGLARVILRLHFVMRQFRRVNAGEAYNAPVGQFDGVSVETVSDNSFTAWRSFRLRGSLSGRPGLGGERGIGRQAKQKTEKYSQKSAMPRESKKVAHAAV